MPLLRRVIRPKPSSQLSRSKRMTCRPILCCQCHLPCPCCPHACAIYAIYAIPCASSTLPTVPHLTSLPILASPPASPSTPLPPSSPLARTPTKLFGAPLLLQSHPWSHHQHQCPCPLASPCPPFMVFIPPPSLVILYSSDPTMKATYTLLDHERTLHT